MIEFFRDFIDGPIYFVVVVICIILIMAIIGYLMEKKKLEQEEKNKRVTLSVSPIEEVKVQEHVVTNNIEVNVQTVPNPIIQSEQINQSNNIQTVNSTLNSEVIEEKQVESTPQPTVQVIDFGSTSSVDIEH